jgi:DNA replication protein DnaC
MDRSDILELMATLKLFGMRAAYDEVMATAIKRQYEPARVIGELLAAEIAEKQARLIKYQMTLAKLPLANTLLHGSAGWRRELGGVGRRPLP